MTRLLPMLMLAAGLTIGLGAQAASHVGGAPMGGDAASAPAKAASGAKKKEKAKAKKASASQAKKEAPAEAAAKP